jgi:flagellar export protein FliJ
MAKEPVAPSDKRVVTEIAFRFRLERVRAVRERKEKIARQELAGALSRRAQTEAELKITEQHLDRAREHQRAVAAGGAVSADDLQARQAFLERIEGQRGMHQHELGLRDAEVTTRDRQLMTAASEHEMLNRLRERRRGEHVRELARIEGNTLDEIAARRGPQGAA